MVRETRPYDVELLQAALLHDIGKGLDPSRHVEAGLEALEGLITERTAFFIAQHMNAHLLKQGKLSPGVRRELQSSPDLDDLMVLEECDTQGRVPGAVVGTVDEALEYLRQTERENEGE